MKAGTAKGRRWLIIAAIGSLCLAGNALAQTQLGADINGEAAGDRSGISIGFSSDGNRVAIGAPFNGASDVGHVRVFSWNGSAWAQLGADIDGEAAGDQSGNSVALSSDGNVVAIGAPFNDGTGTDAGHVRVFTWSGSAWVQRGTDLNGEGVGDSSGISVSLSADGNRVAIGATHNGVTNDGHVRVYNWFGGSWFQLGPDIDGEAAGDWSGSSVALSSDGSRVAIGALLNDGTGSNAGHVRVYSYNGSSWIQLGADLNGEAAGNGFGGSVALSSDGSRVAIGAIANNGAGSNAGHVRVYSFNGSNWVQLGADIDGEAAGDFSGSSIDLSPDGSRVAIGAIGNTGSHIGKVRAYRWSGSAWQLTADIDGEAAGDNSGNAVELSTDGSRMAIGAPFNDGAGASAGHVRVYVLAPELIAGGVAGWYAPSVPYKQGVGNASSAPTVLDGNVNNTIFAYSYTNIGPTTASGFTTNEYIDGVLALSWMPPALAPLAGAQWNSSPRNVRGGLHTMGFQNDATNAIGEANEGNNNHASQWVWSPLPMTLGVPMTRLAPPDPQGGWNDIPVGVTRYPNLDGLRSPQFVEGATYHGMWGAVALTPTDVATNSDLQVFGPLSSDPSNGFRSPDEISARPGDVTDLVVVDVDDSPKTVDVGLLKSAGSALVKVHAVSSFALLGINARNTYGPFSLGPDSLIALYGFPFSSTLDNMTIILRNLSGGANLDFMMFGRTDPSRLYNPGQAVATAATYGDGENEYYKGSIPAYAGLAVLKAGSADVAKKAMFDIVVTSVVGVDDDLPTRIAFGRITPNPAHADAAMRFDLPREMEVDLAAYDVGGRRVSTLANGTWNAGRHAMRWSTVGDGGQPLPSGMYLVRFIAGEYRSTQRVFVIR